MSTPVKCLVPVSGGKDSQASLALALQNFDRSEVLGLFCDTQFEHPTTYRHVAWMEHHYGVRIERVTAGSVEDQAIKHGRFPGGGARFCTEELKIWPTKRFCRELAELQGSRLRNKKLGIEASQAGGFEVWYGMRSGESPDRAKRYAGKVCDQVYAPHEVLKKYPQYLAALGVSFRLCILDWSDLDVLAFLDGKENPLYAQGSPRVGCFPCLASGQKWKRKAFDHDDFGREQWERVQVVSRHINKDPLTGDPLADESADGPGCLVCSI